MTGVFVFMLDREQAMGRDRAEQRIYLRSGLEYRARIKALPGARWDSNPRVRAWHVPATPSALLSVLAEFGADAKLHESMQPMLDTARRQRDAGAAKIAEDLPDTPTRTSAWLHQRQAFHFAKELDAAMLAVAMGGGKSLIAVGLLEEWGVTAALILCPVSVLSVWPKEFEKHALEPGWRIIIPAPRGMSRELPDFERTRLTITTKKNTTEQAIEVHKELELAHRLGQRVAVLVNYESAWRSVMGEMLMSREWGALVCDESHRLKGAGATISKFAARLRKSARHRLALTGTPMPHSPLDIYGQYRFLDPGIFGTSKNRFQNRYAVMGGFENRQVKGWQNEDEMTEKFRSIAFIIDKDEAMPDLPAEMHVEREFDLGKEARRVYDDLAKEFISATADGIVVAANALARLIRLRQITSGHVRTEDDKLLILDEGREKLLREVLDEIPDGMPVVCFCVFHPDLDAIHRVTEDLGLVYGELSGRRRDGLTSSGTMAEVDVVGVQLQSGGVGIDLTRARYGIYYSIDFSLGNYEQSLARIHRPGQKHPVTYLHLLARRTVDTAVYKALRNRKDVIKAVLEAAKRGDLNV